MSSYVLTCCSSADLPKEYFAKNNIPYDEFYKRIAAGSMSSGISVTCNSVLNAKKKLLAKYLDRTIKVVDTLAASSGYGLFLDKPAEMRDADKSLEELYLFAEDNKLKRQSRNKQHRRRNRCPHRSRNRSTILPGRKESKLNFYNLKICNDTKGMSHQGHTFFIHC